MSFSFFSFSFFYKLSVVWLENTLVTHVKMPLRSFQKDTLSLLYINNMTGYINHTKVEVYYIFPLELISVIAND